MQPRTCGFSSTILQTRNRGEAKSFYPCKTPLHLAFALSDLHLTSLASTWHAELNPSAISDLCSALALLTNACKEQIPPCRAPASSSEWSYTLRQRRFRARIPPREMHCRGAAHTGHSIGELLPVKMKNVIGDKTASRGALTASLDGSLAYVAPFWLDSMVAPLRALQKMMELSCRHPAGLNPRSFRQRPSTIPLLASLLLFSQRALISTFSKASLFGIPCLQSIRGATCTLNLSQYRIYKNLAQRLHVNTASHAKWCGTGSDTREYLGQWAEGSTGAPLCHLELSLMGTYSGSFSSWLTVSRIL